MDPTIKQMPRLPDGPMVDVYPPQNRTTPLSRSNSAMSRGWLIAYLVLVPLCITLIVRAGENMNRCGSARFASHLLTVGICGCLSILFFFTAIMCKSQLLFYSPIVFHVIVIIFGIHYLVQFDNHQDMGWLYYDCQLLHSGALEVTFTVLVILICGGLIIGHGVSVMKQIQEFDGQRKPNYSSPASTTAVNAVYRTNSPENVPSSKF